MAGPLPEGTFCLKAFEVLRYDQYADAWDTSVSINIDGETVRFFHTREKGVDRVWVDHECFLAKVCTW